MKNKSDGAPLSEREYRKKCRMYRKNMRGFFSNFDLGEEDLTGASDAALEAKILEEKVHVDRDIAEVRKELGLSDHSVPNLNSTLAELSEKNPNLKGVALHYQASVQLLDELEAMETQMVNG